MSVLLLLFGWLTSRSCSSCRLLLWNLGSQLGYGEVRGRESERGDQSKQQRNALSPSRLLCALPLACHGMCNYSTIKVPVLAYVCVCVCLVTTLDPVNNAAWTERTSESRSAKWRTEEESRWKHLMPPKAQTAVLITLSLSLCLIFYLWFQTNQTSSSSSTFADDNWSRSSYFFPLLLPPVLCKSSFPRLPYPDHKNAAFTVTALLPVCVMHSNHWACKAHKLSDTLWNTHEKHYRQQYLFCFFSTIIIFIAACTFCFMEPGAELTLTTQAHILVLLHVSPTHL